MKQINDLTLVVRFYKPTKTELEYWERMFLILKNKIEIHFMINGTNVQFSDSIPKKNIFKSETDVGRFYIVYNHVKAGNIKTDYFQMINADDYISPEILMKVNFSKAKLNLLLIDKIKYTGERIMNDSKVDKILNSRINILNSRIHKLFTKLGSFPSYSTIYPTSRIVEDTMFTNRERINFAEDTMLGLICIGNGSKVKKANFKSYSLYHKEIGVTRSGNFEEEILENFRTAKIMDEFSKEANIKIDFILKSMIKWSKIKSRKYVKKENTQLSSDATKSLNGLEEILKKQNKKME